MGISLGTLAGPAAVAALRQRGADRRRRLRGRPALGGRRRDVLLALGFLGLAHALLETTVGQGAPPRRRPRCPACAASPPSPASRSSLLAALAAAALWLPGSGARRRARARGSREPPTAGYRERVADGARATAGASPACTRPRTARSCARCSPRPDGATAARDASPSADGTVPSIVDLAPAADWDEREAHDLYGVDFAGHEPLRPLVDHDAPTRQLDRPGARRTTPTRSRSGRSTRA